MKKNKKKLMIASTPQDGRTPTRPFYNPPYRKPDLFIKDKQTIDESKERFKGLTGIDLAMDFKDAMGGGGFVGTSRTNVFVNQGGEAYILEPNGNFKFDGMYAPEIHGPIFPQAKAPKKKDKLKIASHDNRQFKSVPATGARGDNMAPDWLIDYMNRKDENLLQIQQRLKRA